MLRLAVRVSAARAAPALVHGVGAVAPRFARLFSAQDASHDDFKPKLKVDVKDGDAVQRAIDAVRAMVTGKTSANDVKGNKVMLYMKGTPERPLCGFSQRVVAILGAHHVQYHSSNVLDNPAVREGIKKYSDWPTIPQLFVDGEFIGGCDIVTQMHQSGELKQLFASKHVPTRAA